MRPVSPPSVPALPEEKDLRVGGLRRVDQDGGAWAAKRRKGGGVFACPKASVAVCLLGTQCAGAKASKSD